jgi:hypothetical protein
MSSFPFNPDVAAAATAPEAQRWLQQVQPLIAVHVPDIDRADLLKAALRHRALLRVDPATIAARIEENSDLLGLTPQRFVCAALRQPLLLCLRPTTIAANAEESARRLAISRARFVRAALKQPQLLGMRPATLERNTATAARLLRAAERL